MSRPGPATPQHRSSTPAPGAIPPRPASARISPAPMNPSCSTNSPGAYAETRARRRAWSSSARVQRIVIRRTMPAAARKAGDGASVLMGMNVPHPSPARWGRRLRPARSGRAPALVAQALLFGVIAASLAIGGDGLSTAGWAVGITCEVIMSAALARGLSRCDADRLGPADWVTLARGTLAIGVAALAFDAPVPVTVLVSLAALALALDAVDGWVARRTWATAGLGARFDGEVDAFLILVLSVYVSRSAGAWVLAIGAARYAFLVAGLLLPWMREPLPPRYWRKVVAATQGIVLTVAAAAVLPTAVSRAALVVALALLAESFGRDVWWLRRHRQGHAAAAPAAALTVFALLLVWLALVSPDKPILFTPGAFARLPLELVIVVALGVLLP